MKEYGFNEIASLVDARVQKLPDGQIYHTIANGKGLMQGYGHQLEADTRWSVVLYVRALQTRPFRDAGRCAIAIA